MALRVAPHRLRRAARRRGRVPRQGVVVVGRRRAPPAVLAGRRLHVEHRRVRLDVRVDLKVTGVCVNQRETWLYPFFFFFFSSFVDRAAALNIGCLSRSRGCFDLCRDVTDS